jgi:hypothetical protein
VILLHTEITDLVIDLAVDSLKLKQASRNFATYFNPKLQYWISSVFQFKIIILGDSAFSDGSLPLSQAVVLLIHCTDNC